MRDINREIGLDDALRNLGIRTGGNERSDSEGEEKSKKREVEDVEITP